MQQVASPPDSLLLLDSPEAGVDAGQEGAGTGSIFLHIGEPGLPVLEHMPQHCQYGCMSAGAATGCVLGSLLTAPDCLSCQTKHCPMVCSG